jgi:hypothetical protein
MLNALPVLFWQRWQWQMKQVSGSPEAAYLMAPQLQPPRRTGFLIYALRELRDLDTGTWKILKELRVYSTVHIARTETR